MSVCGMCTVTMLSVSSNHVGSERDICSHVKESQKFAKNDQVIFEQPMNVTVIQSGHYAQEPPNVGPNG